MKNVSNNREMLKNDAIQGNKELTTELYGPVQRGGSDKVDAELGVLQHFPKGSVALISIMIISALTLIVVISMTEINFSTSSQSYNSQNDKTAYYTAEACLEEATLQLEADLNYTSGSLTFDADTSCTIGVTDDGQKNVTIQVTYLDYVQNFSATFSYQQNGQASNLHLIDWSET